MAQGEPAAPKPDVAAAPGPAPPGPSSLMSGFLGAMDPDEESSVKAEARDLAPEGKNKRRKVDHPLFFENPNGFKHLIKTFPKIRFRGKGSEFDDLDLLLKHYQKWVKNLYPQGQNFEDFIYKARQVLGEKDKDKEGITSDPKRQLHMFRHMYKSSSASLSSSLDLDKDGKSFHIPSSDLPDDVRQRIEQNRQRALQRKREREGLEQLPEPEPDAFEDMFDPMLGVDDEDEDPFGHGGGLGSSDAPQAPARASAADEEDEDPFGHGGGLGGPAVPAAIPVAPAQASASKGNAATKLTLEQRQKIEENRQKALAKRQGATASEPAGICKPADAASTVPAVASSTESTTNGVDGLDVDDAFIWGPTEVDDDEDVFGFGGGLD